ncbi:MAG: hypothetical protein M9962_03625 [Oligoflexia bacterium]|nr:hypothetical protein [Oligoflexia bacterium]
MSIIKLQAGPFPIELELANIQMYTHKEIFTKFATTECKYPLLSAIHISVESPCDFFEVSKRSILVDQYKEIRIFQTNHEYVVHFWCGLLSEYALELKTNLDFSHARIRTLNKHPHLNHLAFLLTSPLRWIVQNKLSLYGAFMLHGCAIELSENYGIIGTGPSGAGKTTLSSFFYSLNKESVYTDETIIITPNSKNWIAWGTPWHGMLEVVQNKAIALKDIYFLEKTKHHEASILEKNLCFQKIWSEVFLPSIPEQAEKTLQIVLHFLDTQKISVLGFKKSESIVTFLREDKIHV